MNRWPLGIVLQATSLVACIQPARQLDWLRCDPEGRCADGYRCVGGVCVAQDHDAGEAVDAAVAVDAARDSGGADRIADAAADGAYADRRDDSAGFEAGGDAAAFDGPAADAADATVSDGAASEAAVPDVARSDGAVTDAATRDGAVTDVASADGAVTDGASADGAVTDGAVTDGAVTDAATAQPTPIYRSVGPGRATPLASGSTSATLQIASGLATFSDPMPDNVGVGDIIEYDDAHGGQISSLAVIHGRLGATSYEVRSADGGLPLDTVGGPSLLWHVRRAYTALASAIVGDENPGIASQVRNFDTWSGGRNISAAGANEVWHFACYADGVDTSGVGIDSWNTDPENYLHLFTPVRPDQVGVRQRHAGVWDDSKYRLEVSGSSAIWAAQSYLRIEGLQIAVVAEPDGNFAINYSDADETDLRISHNIIRGAGAADAGWHVGIWTGSAGSGTVRIWNNLIYDFAGTYGVAMTNEPTSRVHYLYNNTVVDCGYGLSSGSGGDQFVARNNISVRNDVDYQGVFSPASSNNLSGSASWPAPGAGSCNACPILFVDADHDDYRLAAGDVEARDHGANLSSDPALAFDDDIQGQTRGSVWDIGADEL